MGFYPFRNDGGVNMWMGTDAEKAERNRAVIALQKMQELEKQFKEERQQAREPTLKGVKIKYLKNKKK